MYAPSQSSNLCFKIVKRPKKDCTCEQQRLILDCMIGSQPTVFFGLSCPKVLGLVLRHSHKVHGSQILNTNDYRDRDCFRSKNASLYLIRVLYVSLMYLISAYV